MEKELGLILKRLSRKIQSVVVVDKTGLPIMSFSPETRKPIDHEMEMMTAGIAAAVLTLGEKTSMVLDHGAFKQIIIEFCGIFGYGSSANAQPAIFVERDFGSFFSAFYQQVIHNSAKSITKAQPYLYAELVTKVTGR